MPPLRHAAATPHTGVTRLRFNGTGGNVAVVLAPQGFPARAAAVLHVSEAAFAPVVSVAAGTLSVLNRPSPQVGRSGVRARSTSR